MAPECHYTIERAGAQARPEGWSDLEDPDADQERDHGNDRDDLIDEVLFALPPYRYCRGGVHACCLSVDLRAKPTFATRAREHLSTIKIQFESIVNQPKVLRPQLLES